MKKSVLLAAGLALAVMPMSAQKLTDGYITMPSSGSLHEYISAWNNGNGTIQMNGETWEDEEFFISRVKPKVRFYNTKSQVRTDLTQYSSTNTNGTDKRYVNWVPINDPAFNAIPNGIWDQDVFSMWSYIDHYGDWTSPFGWAPGAFADVAHKNGVAVSGVASVPWGGSIPSGWDTCFRGVANLGSDKVGKFLYYFGVDGLGYNSEWGSPGGKSLGLIDLHDGLKTYMANRNPIWEVLWYAGVTDNGGSNAFDTGISAFTGLYKSASMFLNYNWNNSSYINSSVSTSKNMGKSPFFIYAGMNQQGGEPKSGENYPMLKNYQYSIGMWGAHSCNMFWESRGNAGATTEAVQRYYLDQTELWYTGGSRNPAVRYAINTVRDHRPRADWAGISSMVSARSTLKWDIADEPFYTYFNLGNGKFFNWGGERVSDNPWYSIGVQDYLPTWRYWFAPSFMNGNIGASEVSLNATFTWDDAYFGGSCLQITGSTDEEYLHLFKTDFIVDYGYTVTIRYKLLEGSGNVGLVLSTSEDPTTVSDECDAELFNTSNSADVCDKSYVKGADGWQTMTVEVGGEIWWSGDNIGVIALKFTDVENMKLLIGELRIENPETYGVPAAPQVKSSKVLSNNYAGVDGKIIWKMANTKAVGEPCYNSDVNVSMFKVYAQEEGGEPEFLGVTTSWAAIGFRAKNTDTNKQIRYGVSAVSVDHKTESAISWGSYLSKGTYTPSNEVEIDKSIIKPDEAFTCRYVDPKHSSSTWTLKNAAGTTVASDTGVELHVANGLEQGGYDLILDEGTANERVFGYFVQITGEGVGALPEIYTISRDGAAVEEGDAAVEIELTDTPTLSYTGRKADGSASRCVSLASRYIGCRIGDLGIGGTNTSISVAGWFKFAAIPETSWNFMNISDKSATWPQNTWGWAWNHGNEKGQIQCTFRGAASDAGSPGELHYTFPNTVLQAGVWTHIAWICEYSGTNFRCQLYINGVKQESRWYQYDVGNVDKVARNVDGDPYDWTIVNGEKVGTHTTDQWVGNQTYKYTNNDRIYFGGAAHGGAAIDGIVDDFQVWNKAMTAEDVKMSMNGINRSNISGLSVMCLWDFEEDHYDDFGFKAIGNNSSVKAYSYDYLGNPDGGQMQFQTYEPVYTTGCPFLSGTAYPVVTEAVWKDEDSRKTEFTKAAAGTATEGEQGSATVKFATEGDHNVSLTLQNNYGSDTRQYPVFTVKKTQGIGDIVADGAEMEAYTVDNVLFLEFGADGAYDVEVYNAAGVLVGSKKLNAVAGQNARITLGAKGVYLVKASVNGQLLRTVKVLSK